jgi:hypothetical protein
MRSAKFLILLPLLYQSASFASGGLVSTSSGPGTALNPVGVPGYGQYGSNPYMGNPYGSNPYMGNPYLNNQYMYGQPNGYYRSPYNYSTPYGYNAAVAPGFQPYGANQYGLTYNGRNFRLWRAESGYYYPWVAGYGYNAYPIFVVPQGQTNPSAVLPPISVVVNDLGDYLDKAKEKGKVTDNDFISLKRRAGDLLSKEKSLAYEAGGSLEPDQEADIRRDVDELSGEVARRVRP